MTLPTTRHRPGAAVRVLLCDPDDVSRARLRDELGHDADLRVDLWTSSAEETLAALDVTPIDVVTLVLPLPGIDGVAATILIRARHPATRVVVLADPEDDDRLRAALLAGVAGFLLRATPAPSIAAALRSAAEGTSTVLSPEITRRLVDQQLLPGVPGPHRPTAIHDPGRDAARVAAAHGVSDREREVLAHVCAAESNAGIAVALRLSESTVKSHLSSLLAKLECSSRLHLALRAFELGLADPPRPTPLL